MATHEEANALHEQSQRGDRDVAEGVAEEFHRLAVAWKSDTRHLSKMEQITSHPAYRRIVEIGEAALPLIFQDLDRSGGDWFQALREITKTNPVPPESRGRMSEIREAWLRWGREHGYQWTD